MDHDHDKNASATTLPAATHVSASRRRGGRPARGALPVTLAAAHRRDAWGVRFGAGAPPLAAGGAPTR